MKTEKQVQILRTILLIGGFMIGIGISSLLILYLGKIGAIMSIILGVVCMIFAYYVNVKDGGAK